MRNTCQQMWFSPPKVCRATHSVLQWNATNTCYMQTHELSLLTVNAPTHRCSVYVQRGHRKQLFVVTGAAPLLGNTWASAQLLSGTWCLWGRKCTYNNMSVNKKYIMCMDKACRNGGMNIFKSADPIREPSERSIMVHFTIWKPFIT